jgi:hypothetical protein
MPLCKELTRDDIGDESLRELLLQTLFERVEHRRRLREFDEDYPSGPQSGPVLVTASRGYEPDSGGAGTHC